MRFSNCKNESMVEVGFEPTPPKRLELESSALDHSAIQPWREKKPSACLAATQRSAVTLTERESLASLV